MEEKILDEAGYKQIYNEELLKMVKVREEKFLKGELSLDDFTLKGVLPFLQEAFDAGIKLMSVPAAIDVEDA
ncbi:MAG: hypothetical protein MZV63_36510 [Marinilabiliales bacterium]|nr:hypothetical protein [Marinilabiliales bacterium]